MTTPPRGLTLDHWLAWFETVHPKRIDLRLDRFVAVLDTLGLRNPPYKVITVAGTNGKGSCVAMLESIYWHAGYDVGTFTSPHLWRFNERIRFNGNDAGDAELVEVFEEAAAALGPVTLSYFEASLVAALALFRRLRPDVVVLEVGMGGRLDATNALDTDCALIVSIDLDHREWLGDTREAIGREKAGIVRAGKPVVIGDRAVPSSVLEHAAEVGALPCLIGPDFDFRRAESGWRRARDTDAARPLPLPPYGGDEQLANAASCAAVVEALAAALPVGDAALAAGIANAVLRGRFERHDVDGVEWVFDVGHNPAAAAGLEAALRRSPAPNRTWIVFAAMRDKDLKGVVEPFAATAAGWFVARASADRGATGDELATLLESLGAERVEIAADVAAACAAARAAAAPRDRVVVYGSFHTVGAALEALRLYCAPSPLVDRRSTWTRD
ncbi:MAG TPA: bifunctional folylpolyglutamate synthase/dihydrofolate synthase [Gammaproteobacteria bacterium]|nr:bifunctional folylpolyglutamate synthase/dihydrofolate synthase [Gammaproteobacteria bacterium]